MNRRLKQGIFLFVTVAVAVALGCASEEAPQQSAAPQPASPAQPAAAAQAAPQAPQQPAPAAPAASALPAPAAPVFIQPGAIPTRVARAPAPVTGKGPSGTLVVSEPNLSFPGTLPSKVACTTQDMNHR